MVLLIIGGVVLFVLLARTIDFDDLSDLADDAVLEDTVEFGFSGGGNIRVEGQINQGRFDLYEVTLNSGDNGSSLASA